MRYIGIDPGASGGIAYVDPHMSMKAEGTFGFANKKPKEILSVFNDWVTEGSTVVVEHVHAMPHQGVTSCFNFGQEYGGILWTLELLLAQGRDFSYSKVHSSVWKRFLKLKSYETKTQKKNLSKALVNKLYPNVKVTHQTAEALLLAHYAMMKNEEVL